MLDEKQFADDLRGLFRGELRFDVLTRAGCTPPTPARFRSPRWPSPCPEDADDCRGPRAVLLRAQPAADSRGAGTGSGRREPRSGRDPRPQRQASAASSASNGETIDGRAGRDLHSAQRGTGEARPAVRARPGQRRDLHHRRNGRDQRLAAGTASATATRATTWPALEVVLDDGSAATLSRNARPSPGRARGQVRRAVSELLASNRELIAQHRAADDRSTAAAISCTTY